MARIRNTPKIKRYEQYILTLLEEIYAYRNIDGDNYFQILDTQNKHYQLVFNGFQESIYYYKALLHLQIQKNGKIWIWLNETEELVADELVKKGVEPTDIVLGFQPEKYRAYGGFAVN